MAAKKVAMLREEMGRCMRELNTLRVEELEEELLGSSFGVKKGVDSLRSNDSDARNGGAKRGRPGEGNGDEVMRYAPTDQEGQRNGGAGVDRSDRAEKVDGVKMEVEQIHHSNIWDMVAKLFRQGAVVDSERLYAELEEGMSTWVLMTSWVNENILQNLDALMNSLVLSSQTESAHNLLLSNMIVKEHENLMILHKQVQYEVRDFVVEANHFLGMARLQADDNGYSRFGLIVEHFAFVMMGKAQSVPQQTKLYQKSLSIIRKMMLMATALVHVIAMLKWHWQTIGSDTEMGGAEQVQHDHVWDIVAQLFQVCTFQSSATVCGNFKSNMSTLMLMDGALNNEVLRNLDLLIGKVISEAREISENIRPDPNQKLATVIVAEYQELAALSKQVHQEIKAFSGGDGDDGYLRFNSNFSKLAVAIANPANNKPSTTELYQESLGIIRRIMFMTTHLVQVKSMLKWYKQRA
jgi:hypothetical protein